MTNKDDARFSINPNLLRALIAGIGGLLALFLAAFLTGYTAATFEKGSFANADFAYILGSLALLAIVIYSCWRLWPAAEDTPTSNSVQKANKIVIALTIVSAFLSVFLALSINDDSSNFALYSNSPVSRLVASIALVIWLALVPLFTWQWWKTVDEHEKAAYRNGALVASHVYIIGVPAWWMAARAGWVPHQDPMIVMLIITFLWCAVWFYRKYF